MKVTANMIKENLMLGIRPATGNGIPYLDLEMYPYVHISNEETGVVTEDMYSFIGMTEDEALKLAEANTKIALEAKTMREIMAEFGMYVPEDPVPMIIVRTRFETFGASALFFPEYLLEVCKRYGIENPMIAPSSIHEIIITESIPEAIDMVKEINSDVVAENEQLADHWYYLDMETGKITW